tara:strand:+ start:1386 stop:2243 length:858 start_codon:yes stop_codon:yes gene_type:complete
MDDFCAFILTHGRPDNVITYDTLIRQGFTGKIFIVIDDEDKTADQYYKNFGDKVLMFSKDEMAKKFDEGDNFNDRRCIIYARNACFELAEKVSCAYFIQLDDDYTDFLFRFWRDGKLKGKVVKDLNYCFKAMLKLFLDTKATTIAISQGGDWIGGGSNPLAKTWFKRKAMNSFFCSTKRPFKFYGRLNEDVNFYTNEGRKGKLIYTIGALQLNQKQTQASAGGMTDIYLDGGTYIKSFYSVMYSPSCVKIGLMGRKTETQRIHHSVKWNNAVPKIVDFNIKKTGK